jgi:hypothetical protein
MKLTAVATVAGIGLGAWGNSVVNGGGSNELRGAYELEVSEGATGQGFDAKRFVNNKVKPVSGSVVAFALDSMTRLSGENPQNEPDAKVKAAAACTLLLAAGQPMSDKAKVSWGSGQSTEDLDQDGAEERADAFYADAEKQCRDPLVALADAGKIGELLVPVAIAED